MSGDDDISNRDLLKHISEERDKSESRLIADRIASESRTKDHMDTIGKNLELLVGKSIREYHEENIRVTLKMFPNNHTEDHSFIEMVRSNFKSFMDGMFGSLGKVVLFLILIGIGLQFATMVGAITIGSYPSAIVGTLD